MEIEKNKALAPYTTFHTGGVARFLVEVRTEAELAEAVAYARAHALPLTILGGGSNVLVPDEGVEGLVIVLCIKGVEIKETDEMVLLTVGAGEMLDEVIAETVARGYWGLENLSYIPGTVGATPVQNVGAYGVEVGERIVLVRVYDTLQETFTVLSSEECRFAYRDSLFKHKAGAHYIVTAVTFLLQTKPAPVVSYRDLALRFQNEIPTQAAIREAVIAIRKEKFPDWTVVGTAGSFFKNPIISVEQYTALQIKFPEIPMYPVTEYEVKIPLGWILDKILGLKGVREGAVGCYEGQALVLVNYGDATTSDVLAFADMIAKKVFDVVGVMAEKEVRVLEKNVA